MLSAWCLVPGSVGRDLPDTIGIFDATRRRSVIPSGALELLTFLKLNGLYCRAVACDAPQGAAIGHIKDGASQATALQ